MTSEISDESKKASMLLEEILDSEGAFDALRKGKEEGHRIIDKVCSHMADEPAVQAEFLKAVIGALSQEKNLQDTDRRDCAYEILNQPEIMDLLPDKKEILLDSYFQALNQQGKDNDPFGGSINSLLEAGEVLAPYFPHDELTRTQLEKLWTQIAHQFSYGGEREHIESSIPRIIERMTRIGSRDARVEYLKGRKFTIEKIMEREGIGRTTIENSVSRLIDQGKLDTPNELWITVKQLHDQGFSIKEIADKLNKKYGTISRSLYRHSVKKED